MNTDSTPPCVPLNLRVQAVQSLNPLIRLLRLAAADGAALPGWSPGAHIQVQVHLPDGSRDWRHYSLIDLEGVAGAPDFAPGHYTIAVRLEDAGRGGSRFMHRDLGPGDMLPATPPKNDFALHEAHADGEGETVLVAGGIGITPLASMAAHCHAQGRAVRLHYAGRSRALMAFLPELQALLGAALRVHADDEAAGALFDAGALLDGCGARDRVYVCGPRPLLDAVLAAAEARGWAPGRVHFELFATDGVQSGDQPFEVTLAQSGQTYTVPAGQSLLDCLIAHGCDPMFDCKRGECGVCTTPVLEGEIDHRDYVLTAGEKQGGKVMQICVSRAKGRRLVLDM